MRQRLSHVRRPLGPVRWYLEGDHLLAADQRCFNLYYRRFYYEDIRSVVIWRTKLLWLWLAVEGGVGGSLILLAWVLHATAALEVLAAMTGIILAAELAAGPRADARIETSHSVFHAPLVRRWRQCEKTLASLAARLPAATQETAKVAAE